MSSYTENQINDTAERLMDYYKDGKYSYTDFRDEFPGEAIPGKFRTQKGFVKKSLEELNERVETDIGVEGVLAFVFNSEEENIKKRRDMIKNLRNEIRSQKERIEQLENAHDNEDTQMEREYKKELMKEIANTEQGRELQRHRERERKRYKMESRKQDEVQRLRELHTTEKADLQQQLAELTLISQEKKKGSANSSSTANMKYKKKYLKLQIKYDELLKKNQSSDEETTSDEED